MTMPCEKLEDFGGGAPNRHTLVVRRGRGTPMPLIEQHGYTRASHCASNGDTSPTAGCGAWTGVVATGLFLERS